jgi:HEPN domain-containing protein
VNQPADYVQQALHNSELAAYLRSDKTPYLDWAVTCLFYSALHYVNAFLAKNHKTIPRRHATHGDLTGRSNIVQADPILGQIYGAYRHLEDESRDARYELRKPTPYEYDQHLLSKLTAIRDFIMPKVTN